MEIPLPSFLLNDRQKFTHDHEFLAVNETGRETSDLSDNEGSDDMDISDEEANSAHSEKMEIEDLIEARTKTREEQKDTVCFSNSHS